jgi:predicted dehydrogenase
MNAAALRYILLGAGGMGADWCRNVLPRLHGLGKATPAAAVDRDPAALLNAQQHLGLSPERCYTDMARAFDEAEADFAIIVLPPALHEAAVDLALAHDMDILSEKPLADTMEACCRIHRKVIAAGRKMAITMSHRFDADKLTLERLVKSGEYGPLHYVVVRFTTNCRAYGSIKPFRHEMAHPLLIEGAVHQFDILRAVTGADAQRVYAVTWNPPWGEFKGDTTALVTMQMTNGVRCFYEGAEANASCINGWNHDYIRAECRDGTLELDARRLRVLTGAMWDPPTVRDLPLDEHAVTLNAHIAEMFCDWLTGRRDSHPTRLEDNIQCAAMLFAAIESADTGQPVDVQAFLRHHLPDPSRREAGLAARAGSTQ